MVVRLGTGMLARAALRLSSLRPGLQPRQQLRFGSGAGAPKGGGGYGSGEYRGIKVPPERGVRVAVSPAPPIRFDADDLSDDSLSCAGLDLTIHP